MTLRGQNFFSVFITFFTRIESTLNDLHRVPLNFSLPEHIHLICLKIFQTSKNLDLAVKPSPNLMDNCYSVIYTPLIILTKFVFIFCQQIIQSMPNIKKRTRVEMCLESLRGPKYGKISHILPRYNYHLHVHLISIVLETHKIHFINIHLCWC